MLSQQNDLIKTRSRSTDKNTLSPVRVSFKTSEEKTGGENLKLKKIHKAVKTENHRTKLKSRP